MAAGKWSEMPSGPGIYGVWSQNMAHLYVGSTGDLSGRLQAYRPAVLLGCKIEIGMSLPNTTRAERNAIEDRLILALRARGLNVVNQTNEENHRTHLRHTPEKYRDIAQKGLGRLTPEERSKNGAKGARTLHTNRRDAVLLGAQRGIGSFTAEQRSANGRAGANARWANHAKGE
jgi:hypothetical protein